MDKCKLNNQAGMWICVQLLVKAAQHGFVCHYFFCSAYVSNIVSIC